LVDQGINKVINLPTNKKKTNNKKARQGND